MGRPKVAFLSERVNHRRRACAALEDLGGLTVRPRVACVGRKPAGPIIEGGQAHGATTGARGGIGVGAHASMGSGGGTGVADAEGELLDMVDEENRVVGQELRGKCHREGIRHRAVYCLLLDADGRLLLQRRSPAKKIAPSKWDLSVAEHLGVGEEYRAAAARGLWEELGVTCQDPEALVPLTEPHKHEVVEPSIGVCDREFVQTFAMRGYAGPVTMDPAEVAEVRWVGVHELRAEMASSPDSFTPWFVREFSREDISTALAEAPRA